MKEINEDNIIEWEKEFDYRILYYPAYWFLDKKIKGNLSIPKDYKKQDWDDNHKSNFIEFLLLDLPVKDIQIKENIYEDNKYEDNKYEDNKYEDNRYKDNRYEDNISLEIIDGVQRINSLLSFLNNQLQLRNLKVLKKLNDFRFSDLTLSRQRKFKTKLFRIVCFSNNN